MTTSNDLVVVVPGILGSTLRRDGTLVWGPSGGSVIRAIATFGGAIRELQPPSGLRDEEPDDGVEAVALMPDIHALPGLWTPVKGYTVLVNELTRLGFHTSDDAPVANLVRFAYDWRLSNRVNAHRLARVVETALGRWREHDPRNADARVVFVCHSMGGLIARWYVARCGGAEVTRKVLTLGTPYRGAAKALAQLVNGVHYGFGRFSIDLTALLRSLPSAYELLPEYACIDVVGSLRRTTEVSVPNVPTDLARFGTAFHDELAEAETALPSTRDATHAIVGTRQPTITTVRLTDLGATALDSYLDDEEGGDSTVPLVGATRRGIDLDSNTLRRVPDRHGNLHRNRAALDEIGDVITGPRGQRRGISAGIELSVDVPDFLFVGQPLPVRITSTTDERHAVVVKVTDERGVVIHSVALPLQNHTVTTIIDDLPPGAYAIDVAGTGPAAPVRSVSADTLVWDPRVEIDT